MTSTQLYPPIASATVLMILWVGVAWRFHKNSEPGQEGILYCLWLLIIPAILVAYFYFGDPSAVVTSGWQVLIAAIAGEGFAIIVVFALNNALFGKRPLGTRIYFVLCTVALATLLVWSTVHL